MNGEDELKHTLYTWQQHCIDSWYSNGGHGIVQVVTGAGKTIMALECAARLNAKAVEDQQRLYVKIIVPTISLIAQWKTNLLYYCHELGITRSDIGVYHGGHKDRMDRKIMIHVVNSARYTLARQIDSHLEQGDSVLLIADECHHYASTENRKIFEFLSRLTKSKQQRYFSLGLSATPLVDHFEEVLIPSLGPLVFSFDFSSAMKMDVINKCIFYHIAIQFDKNERTAYERVDKSIKRLYAMGKDYLPESIKIGTKEYYWQLNNLKNSHEADISEWAAKLLGMLLKRKALIHNTPSRIACTLALVDRLEATAKIIIFSERIHHVEVLHDKMMSMYPNRIARYHSGMDDLAKQHALERFRNDEARILLCCRALDEGLDIPAADVGIVVSGTSSERQRIQRLGRILRRNDGKTPSSLFYLYVDTTVESPALFLKPIQGTYEFNLWFDNPTTEFVHPAYDQWAYHLFSQERKRGLSSQKQDQLYRMLRIGQARNDWLLPQVEIEFRLATAESQQLRNYWIVMLRLSRLRTIKESFEELDYMDPLPAPTHEEFFTLRIPK